MLNFTLSVYFRLLLYLFDKKSINEIKFKIKIRLKHYVCAKYFIQCHVEVYDLKSKVPISNLKLR